jgi:hypothetical protein
MLENTEFRPTVAGSHPVGNAKSLEHFEQHGKQQFWEGYIGCLCLADLGWRTVNLA